MIGAAIFQSKLYDPSGVNTGFRCVHGGNAEKFSGTGELPTNFRWLTNISAESAFNSQLKNTPRLLDDKYLRVSTSSIILELGLKSKPIEEQALAISHVFHNTMALSEHFFGIDEPPHGCLAAGLTGQIGHFQPKVFDSQIALAAQKSILQFAQCERSVNSNSRLEYVSLIIPRVTHAKHMLAEGIPYDDFYLLSDKQLPVQDQRLNWVLKSDLPMLCKIKINNIDKAFNHLINWGNGAGFLRKDINNRSAIKTGNQREFVTSNELKVLAQFCNFQIEQVAISNTPVESRIQLPGLGNTSELSYSYGIIVENFWCALLRDPSGKYVHTPMTAWIHANDRMACLSYAKNLSDAGYIINGYGYGRITVAIEPERKNELKLKALSIGLLPYLELDVLEEDIDITDVQSSFELLKLIYSSGHLPFIFEMDKAYLTEVSLKND